MAFNKEAFLEEVKPLLKEDVKENGLEFLEETAKTLHEVLNIYVKHLNNPLIASIVLAAGGVLTKFIEDINPNDNK